MFILLICTCILTTQAITCDNGYYGSSCQLKCRTECINNTCQLSRSGIEECTLGCKPGFYGTRCNIPCTAFENTCRKCPQECEGGFCQLGLSCAQGCQDSYYGTACKSCPAWCEVCNRVSGTCEGCLHCEGDCTQGCHAGCKLGYFGKFCEHSCSSKCVSECNQISGYCFKCKSGLFGDTCKDQCPRRCVADQCNMDGICTSGCRQGWYGQRCESKCGTGCAKGNCNKKGICTDGCRKGLYGEQCQDKCPVNCFKKRCDIEDGFCRSCKKGFFGSLCNKTCERCFGGSCIQHAGQCTKGCVSNYTGEFCQNDWKLETGNCTADECRDAGTTASISNTPAEPVDSPRYLIARECLASIVLLIFSGYVLYHVIRKRIKHQTGCPSCSIN